MEKELEMARLFFKEKDYQPAMDRVLKARGLVQDLKEEEGPDGPGKVTVPADQEPGEGPDHGILFWTRYQYG